MSAVVTIALPVFALIATGALAARGKLLGEGATVALNQFVLLLALPAVLFQAMAGIAPAALLHWRFLLAFAGPIVITAGLAYAMAARAKAGMANATIQALAASFANVGYMGIPLCRTAFGDAALVPAIITLVITATFQFGAALTLVEIGVQATPDPRRALRVAGRALARNPMLIAPFAGLLLALTGLGLPVPVDRFLTLLGAAATPCALVAVGLQLGATGQHFRPRLVGWLVFLKLIIQPAAAYVIAYHLLVLPPVWAATAVVMSALPTGSSAFVLARLYGREVATCSGTVLVATVLSFATLSVLLTFFAPVEARGML